MKQRSLQLIIVVSFLIVVAGLIAYLSYGGAPSQQVLPQNTPLPPPVSEVKKGPYEETHAIAAGDTLASILSDLAISPGQAQEAITALSKVFDPKDLKVDQHIDIIYDVQPGSKEYSLKSLSLQPDIGVEVSVKLTDNGLFEARERKKQLQHHYAAIEGNINMSLYADALKAGASPKMLYDMIKALSYDIDFQRDIQPGTEFSLFYDTYKDRESGLERPGALLHAKLVIEDKAYEIYRFQPKGGVPGYYTQRGEGVQKALLRTPIDGARLSSGFGNRKHPILGFTKMHKGVDFAAPKGTPIMAAGEGVVERCSPYGAYGNYVCVRHNGNMKTAYAHLSRYAKGMGRGKRVRQGQIIGYVGNTGRATGPHLHFELIQCGKHVNPQKISQLPTSKLTGKPLSEFKAHMAKLHRLRQGRKPSI